MLRVTRVHPYSFDIINYPQVIPRWISCCFNFPEAFGISQENDFMGKNAPVSKSLNDATLDFRY